jgi:DNA invertase Pin-like site-specific DNA recombinase
VLIVAKLDRLSRSLIDFAALMERSRRRGWNLVALDLGVDTSTPQGEMMASVMATFAQYERRLIGLRTKEALAVRRSQGVRLGRPPIVDESTASRIASLRKQGASYREIAAQLHREEIKAPRNGSTWHPNSVRRIALATPKTR